MARRRRPGSCTSVVDGQAEIIIPLESIIDPDGQGLTFRAVAKWLRRAGSYPSMASSVDEAVAVVLDRFAWDLHLADIGHATDTHDGDEFFDAAVSTGHITVYVVDGVDPRRSKPEDLDAAARGGDVVVAVVAAFPVDVLQS